MKNLNLMFLAKLRVFSKKKKGLHLESVSEIPIFVPKSGCPPKKKSLHSESVSEIINTNCKKLHLFS